mgnify:CR=1 FL=1
MIKTAQYFVVLVTAPKLTVARKLARGILKNRLAACANLISGVESHYWWEGKMCRDVEMQMVMKTSRAKLKVLENFVLAEHPYDTPEFVVLSIDSGSCRYLKWVEKNMKD